MKTYICLVLLAASVTSYAQKPGKKDAARIPAAKLKSQQILKTDSVYITGKVANFLKYKEKANSVNVIINDLAFGKQLTYRGKINDDGTYRMSFIKTGAQDVMFQYNRQIAGVLVSPGDHMQIDFDAAKFEESLAFNGAAATLNQEYQAYNKAKDAQYKIIYGGDRFARFEAQSASEKDNNPEVHKNFLTERYHKENAFLAEYIKQHKPSPAFVKWATEDIKYGYYDDLMRYTWLHPMYAKLKRDSFIIPDAYFDFIKPNDLNNISASVTSNYGSYLHEYSSYISNKIKSNIVDDRMKAIWDQPAGIAKDVLLSNQTINLVNAKALDLVKTYIDRYKASVVQPVFKARVVKAYDDAVYLMNNYTMPVNAQLNNLPKSEADSMFNKIVNKYAGKVVYIDFWATWCGPCRAEMPNSKVLHEKLAGKDVVFLYLGVQSDEKTWKSSIAEMGIEGEHFLLSENDFSAISAKFQISGIPRYLLVDKAGRVVDETAKRPGDEKLQADIEKLLAVKQE